MQCISPRNLECVAISEICGGVPNCKFRSHDPNSASLGVKFSSSVKGLHAVYFPIKFGMRSFIRSIVMDGVPKFKFRSRDPDHAHVRGHFVVHWLVHVTFNVCTKYEIYIFNYSKDIRGSHNLLIIVYVT